MAGRRELSAEAAAKLAAVESLSKADQSRLLAGNCLIVSEQELRELMRPSVTP